MRTLLFSLVLSVVGTVATAQDANPTSLPKKICNLPGNESIVPNILGFSPTKAKELIEACGFTYDGATDVHTLSYEAIGTVGDQQPSGGTIAKKGSMVRGFVSVGLYPPSFVGLDANVAEAYYKDFRHRVNKTYERNPADVGKVIRHSPANAELYNSGLPLNLVVSEGLYVDVPAIAGMEYGSARKLLESKGLVVVHGGGYKDYMTVWHTNCEYTDHYPVVATVTPEGRVYEGNTISLTTREQTKSVLLPEPPGTGVIGQEPVPSICR